MACLRLWKATGEVTLKGEVKPNLRKRHFSSAVPKSKHLTKKMWLSYIDRFDPFPATSTRS